MNEEIVVGRVYEHFKDGRYLVLFLADDSTNNRKGNKVVVYVSLTYGVVKTRDISEFLEPVEWPDGVSRPRFVLSD
jgi:hypothetical protein